MTERPTIEDPMADRRSIAACRPVVWSAENIGMPPAIFAQVTEPIIYPGSTTQPCQGCGLDIYVGPKVQEAIARNLVERVLCFRCGYTDAADSNADVTVQSLGNGFVPEGHVMPDAGVIAAFAHELAGKATETGWDGPAFLMPFHFETTKDGSAGLCVHGIAPVETMPDDLFSLEQMPEHLDGVLLSFEAWVREADETGIKSERRGEARYTIVKVRPSDRIPPNEPIDYSVMVRRGEEDKPIVMRGVLLGRINQGLDMLVNGISTDDVTPEDITG